MIVQLVKPGKQAPGHLSWELGIRVCLAPWDPCCELQARPSRGMDVKEGQDTHSDTLKLRSPPMPPRTSCPRHRMATEQRAFIMSFISNTSPVKKNYQEHMYWPIWTNARPETRDQKAMGRVAGLQGPELSAWFCLSCGGRLHASETQFPHL